MKKRNVLTNWKLQNPRLSTVPKDTFPRLLKKALEKIDAVQAKPNAPFSQITQGVKRNLMSAFKSTGIFPISREVVLKRLPPVENADPTNAIESCLTNYLKEQRFGGPLAAPRRRTRLNVEPGASVSTANPVIETAAIEDDIFVASDAELRNNIADTNTDHDTQNVASSESEAAVSEAHADLHVGRFVLAKFYSGRGKKTYKYVCRIIDLDPLVVEGFKSMENKKDYKLVRDDISEIEESDILAYLPKPKPLTGHDVECVQFRFDVDILELK